MSSEEEELDNEFPCSSLVTIRGEGHPSECGYCHKSSPGSVTYGAS